MDEEREAARALKGSMLRQEVYVLTASASAPTILMVQPYTVAEQNFTVSPVQPRCGNRHAVFFTHPREAITTTSATRMSPRIQTRTDVGSG